MHFYSSEKGELDKSLHQDGDRLRVGVLLNKCELVLAQDIFVHTPVLGKLIHRVHGMARQASHLSSVQSYHDFLDESIQGESIIGLPILIWKLCLSAQ